MKIQVLSDIHCEFMPNEFKSVLSNCQTDADVLIVAGDLSTMPCFKEAITLLCDMYPNVIFVIGNHEYYHYTPAEVHKMLNDIKIKNFHWLHNETLELNGKIFAGTPLWYPRTPRSEFGPQINDPKCIRGYFPWVWEQNKEAIHFLRLNVKNSNVIITHHMPAPDCVLPEFRDNQGGYNAFFLCDMSELIKKAKPPLWICGHTHGHIDITCYATRIVANPLGYPSERRTSKFISDFTIEI